MLSLFIRKPVLAAALSFLIVLLGIVAYKQLPVRDYPVLPASRVTITTTYPGASPKVMEGFISVPIQQALSGLDGVDYITSANTEDQSLITIKFHLGTDVDRILPQISNRVNSILWKLPKGINGPFVQKVNPNQGPTGGVQYFSFYSPKMTFEQITSYLKRNVQTELEALPGVAQVILWGKRVYAMRVWLNPVLMAAHGVTASDVYQALLANNMQSTAGTLKGKNLLFNVTVNSNISTAKAFNRIVVKKVGNEVVRIGDIGHATLGAEKTMIVGTQEGHQTIVAEIVPKSKANAIDVAQRIYHALDQMRANMPASLHYQVLLDKTKFSRKSINEVHMTLIEACIFVFLVIFFFLGSLRLLLIPIVTIPLSLLGAFAMMAALGYSLNSLTFLAMVLAIGLVVDDAIVVIENVHRHIINGQKPLTAAIDGIKELALPVVAMTLTVAIVLLPIGFVPGFSGALFKEFAFSMALVVLISGVLALFVSPAMCATILRAHDDSHSSFSMKLDRALEWLRLHYKTVLRQVIDWRLGVLALFVVLLGAGYFLSRQVPSELIPQENEGVVNAIGMAPAGMNQYYGRRYGAMMNAIFKQYNSVKTYGVFYGFPNGPTNVIGFITLKPKSERQLSEDQMLAKVNAQLQRIPGIFAFAIKMPTLPGAINLQPVGFVLKTSGSYEFLNEMMQKLMRAAIAYPGLANVQDNLQIDQFAINVDINREKAAALGVPVSEISRTLAIMLGEPVVNRFGIEGRSYEVIPQVYRRFRMNPSQIAQLYYVRTDQGSMIPLSDVVSIHENMASNSLNQFQQMHSATLTASVAPGYTIGEVLHFLRQYTQNHLHNVAIDYKGQSRQYIQTQGLLLAAFIFAVVLIYLLLTVNFTSFKDPLIVMLSVPLSLVGGVYLMYLTGATFNIYTKIGLIMLVGLISKHGILIVSFANKLQEHQGFSRLEAAVEAASIRLRPILMTTAAMIGGALPLVLATGAGHEARQQIGWVIIGGMALGTCLTLFVVPTAYACFAKKILPEVK